MIPNQELELEFKTWCIHKWYEHQKEVLAWEGRVVDYDIEEWFEKNELFLKKMFEQKGVEDGSI